MNLPPPNIDPTLFGATDLELHFPARTRGQQPVRALAGVTFNIFPGEAVALVGESGCGKTTLLHCLFGLLTPTSGSVRFRGQEISTLRGTAKQRFRREAQLVFQDAGAALNPRLRIREAVSEPLLAHGLLPRDAARGRAQELLDMVEIPRREHEALPSQLSEGQRHRVVLARALALTPVFLAADEPLSSLDVLTRSRMLDLLLRLREQQRLTMLIVSHDRALVRQFCTRTLAMAAGKLVAAQP